MSQKKTFLDLFLFVVVTQRGITVYQKKINRVLSESEFFWFLQDEALQDTSLVFNSFFAYDFNNCIINILTKINSAELLTTDHIEKCISLTYLFY